MKKLMILLTMTMFFMACGDNGVAANPDTNIPQETPSSSSNTPGIIPLANSSDSHPKTLEETCQEHLLKAIEYTNNASFDKICPVYRNILNQMVVLYGSLTATDYDYCVTIYNCK